MAEQRRRRRRRRGRRRRRRRSFLPVILVFFFVVIVVGVIVGSLLIRKYSLSNDKADYKEYYHLTSDDDLAIIMQDEKAEVSGKVIGGIAYIPFELVQNTLNSRFYWDNNENVMLYTLPNSLIKVELGSSEYYIGKEKADEGYNILKAEGDMTYIALDFVCKYSDMKYDFYEDPNRVEITYEWRDQNVATIKGKEAVRVKAGIKSPVLKQCKKGEKVIVLETEEGIEEWTKVRTEDGFIGYVRNKNLGNVTTETLVSDTGYQEPEWTHNLKDYTINYVWHNVTNRDANESVYSSLASTKGVTTIGPTWFSIADNDGNLDSIADTNYVNYCHQNNIEVWAAVDNFKEGVSSFDVLSYTSKRENLENQLIAQAIQYSLDGINIDFERLSVETGVHFIQFVREMSVKCRQNNLVLSVDNYVPKAYSNHYYRKEQGVVADYVIIMGYDEHYAGSLDSGSVASIDFVREGIEKTVAEVPANQVINGIPFFTRIWKETPKSQSELDSEDTTAVDYVYRPNKVASEADGMNVIPEVLERWGVSPSWDEETKQYYVEYQGDGILYKIWMEEERSIEEKLKLMKEYNLAGVAEWKLGLEEPVVWDVILKYVN